MGTKEEEVANTLIRAMEDNMHLHVKISQLSQRVAEERNKYNKLLRKVKSAWCCCNSKDNLNHGKSICVFCETLEEFKES